MKVFDAPKVILAVLGGYLLVALLVVPSYFFMKYIFVKDMLEPFILVMTILESAFLARLLCRGLKADMKIIDPHIDTLRVAVEVGADGTVARVSVIDRGVDG